MPLKKKKNPAVILRKWLQFHNEMEVCLHTKHLKFVIAEFKKRAQFELTNNFL